MLVEARGDVWTLPAENGTPRNLTRSSGVAERDPVLEPRRQVDRLVLRRDRRLRALRGARRRQRRAAPADLRRRPLPVAAHLVARLEEDRLLRSLEHAPARRRRDRQAHRGRSRSLGPFPPQRVAWSSDSAWLAYPKTGEAPLQAIWLYDVKQGKATAATSGRFNDGWPTFDRKGDFLYFTSQRDFTAPTYEDVGTTFVYAEAGRLYALPLRKDVQSPLAAKSDEEGDAKKEGEEAKKEKRQGRREETRRTARTRRPRPRRSPSRRSRSRSTSTASRRRAILLPVDKRQLRPPRGERRGQAALHAPARARARVRRPAARSRSSTSTRRRRTSGSRRSSPASTPSRSPPTARSCSPGRSASLYLVDAEAGAEAREPGRARRHDRVGRPARRVARRSSTNAWRLERDFFYDPNMHGVDWNGDARALRRAARRLRLARGRHLRDPRDDLASSTSATPTTRRAVRPASAAGRRRPARVPTSSWRTAPTASRASTAAPPGTPTRAARSAARRRRARRATTCWRSTACRSIPRRRPVGGLPGPRRQDRRR